MKLISLEMQNFRQHVDSRIDFLDGVTGIIGSNGSGKSTILEAVAWALYGAQAVRGTNDTIRSMAAEGGAKANVSLTFELSGMMYKVSRTLDASGRTGHAVLEADGKSLRSGMSEVSDTIAKLLGMDYRAFFTSFFTGQKQLEFMSQMDGRARGTMISRMLGYDRVTKARDQANEDRKGLQREIDGLEKGLADPEELKARHKEADALLERAQKTLEEAENEQKALREVVERLKPLKEISDQKAKRYDEVTRRLELDKSDVARTNERLIQLKSEFEDLQLKQKELDSLKEDLRKYEEAGQEYKKLNELQKFEGERQRINGQVLSLEHEINQLEVRLSELADSESRQSQAAEKLARGEDKFAQLERDLQSMREKKIAHEHSLHAQIKQLEWQKKEIVQKRAKIVEAGKQGKCPTCERPLAEELPTVLENFDRQIIDVSARIDEINKSSCEPSPIVTRLDKLIKCREQMVKFVDSLRKEKAAADAVLIELNGIRRDIKNRKQQLVTLKEQLDKLPIGFDQDRFRELHKIGEELRPVRERAVALRSALERVSYVSNETKELKIYLDTKAAEVAVGEHSIKELSFSKGEHEILVQKYEGSYSKYNAALVMVERQRGEVKAANAALESVKREEDILKSRLAELKAKRSEHIHLQTLAEGLDKFRVELNDRIRPELEGIASELVTTMTDGRYNTIEINDSYQAMIRDDGELKPVISGGEDDIVNLALRLAISQMIAERAGQSFSLLVLDEVFGSLDDVRRNNVVSLLQNLKNRFEQIIIITHIESIHNAVDNCIWVEFDERTKTSRLTDRANDMSPVVVGTIE